MEPLWNSSGPSFRRFVAWIFHDGSVSVHGTSKCTSKRYSKLARGLTDSPPRAWKLKHCLLVALEECMLIGKRGQKWSTIATSHSGPWQQDQHVTRVLRAMRTLAHMRPHLLHMTHACARVLCCTLCTLSPRRA